MSGEERKPHKEGLSPRAKPEPPDESDEDFLRGEDIGDDDVFYDDDVCTDDDNDSTLNGNSSLDDDSTPIVEMGSSIDEASLPTVEDTPPTVEEKRPSIEEEGGISDEQFSAEKECQTDEQNVVHRLISNIEEDVDSIEELEYAKQVGRFFNKGCQTNSVTEIRAIPIVIDVRLETSSSSSSSLNATGYDSGSTLKDCPSIEEEEVPPDPVEGILLKISAQVMIRSDANNAWIPEGKGGISVITITKIETPHRPGCEGQFFDRYMVRGRMKSDNRVTLTCHLSQNFQYKRAVPGFHHWKSDNERFGLTFLSVFEAASFDKAIKDAVYAYMLQFDPNAVPFDQSSCPEYSFSENKPETPDPPPPAKPDPPTAPAARRYFIEEEEEEDEEEKIQSWESTDLPGYLSVDPGANSTKSKKENERPKRRQMRKTKKAPRPLRIFKRVRRDPRLQCKHCFGFFDEETNRKGQCRHAPSYTRDCINCITCKCLARPCIGLCMCDPEPDFIDPCTCRNDGTRGIRWFGLTVLSFFCPCLVLYPLLRECYDCGAKHGVCGGPHERRVATPQDLIVYY